MNSISFSWDDRKNKANQKKQRVSFDRELRLGKKIKEKIFLPYGY
jgi:uncharacterized DUF497 family protein